MDTALTNSSLVIYLGKWPHTSLVGADDINMPTEN
jgi:hypothetical protein